MFIIQVFLYIKRCNVEYKKNGGVEGFIFIWGFFFMVMVFIVEVVMIYCWY